MGKINFYHDPYAAYYAKQIAAIGDQLGALAPGLSTTSGLTNIGKAELGKISEGRYGDTMLAGAVRNEAGRNLQALKNSYGLGTMALRLGGNPHAGMYYDRLYRKREADVQDEASDKLTRMLPDYLSAAGEWEQADNNLTMKKANLLAQQAGITGTAAGVMRSGTYAKEKKGFLDNLGSLGAGLSALGVAI